MGKPDYKSLFDTLENDLDLILQMQNKSLETSYTEESPFELRKNVKNFTSDVESVLDFIAWFIFEEIYLNRFMEQNPEEKEIENYKRSISFPNKKKSRDFRQQMEKMFPNIQNEFPDLYEAFRKTQPYNNSRLMDSWLYLANKLANDTKHRSLIRIDSREIMDIDYLELPGNSSISNLRIVGAKHAISINDVPLTKKNAKHLGVNKFFAEVKPYYLINGLGLHLDDTLRVILDGLSTTIRDIEQHLPNS